MSTEICSKTIGGVFYVLRRVANGFYVIYYREENDMAANFVRMPKYAGPFRDEKEAIKIFNKIGNTDVSAIKNIK